MNRCTIYGNKKEPEVERRTNPLLEKGWPNRSFNVILWLTLFLFCDSFVVLAIGLCCQWLFLAEEWEAERPVWPRPLSSKESFRGDCAYFTRGFLRARPWMSLTLGNGPAKISVAGCVRRAAFWILSASNCFSSWFVRDRHSWRESRQSFIKNLRGIVS